MADITFDIKKDFGTIGDGKWPLHLTYTSFNDGEPKFDLRPWNDDMSKMGKGVRLDDGQLYDLMCMIEDILDVKEG